MKISKKLQDRIRGGIRSPMDSFMYLLDEEDRSERMPHSQWQKLHKAAVECCYQAEENAIETILGYNK